MRNLSYALIISALLAPQWACSETHADETILEPCTRSTALGAGWSWRVPLYSRVGTGYVFSSAFRSDDEAISEFLEFLRARGEQVGDLEPKAIAMRIGRR